MAWVLIGLGSNLHDREANLAHARELLAARVEVVRTSALYETDPWGYAEQPAFLNQVLAGETALTPLRLLNFLKKIEAQMGREKTFRYGPRLIDLDILAYDQMVIRTRRLEIPHPRIAERAFVLVPLVEIAPEWVHPGLGKTARELLQEISTEGVRRW